MKTKTIICALAVLLLPSCATAPSQLGFSLISDIKEPTLINSNVGASKEGIACGRNILGVYASGDMSIETATKNGKITKISSVEKTIENAVFTSKVCTIVRGN